MSQARFVEHELMFPVELGRDTITKIRIRRPKGRDLRFLPAIREGQNPAPEDMFPFLALLIQKPNGEELSEEFLEECDMADINALNEVVAGFSQQGERKGTRPRTSRAK